MSNLEEIIKQKNQLIESQNILIENLIKEKTEEVLNNEKSNIVGINASGVKILVSKQTLLHIPDTYFHRMLDPKYKHEKIDNYYFLDIRPDVMRYIIDILQHPGSYNKITSGLQDRFKYLLELKLQYFGIQIDDEYYDPSEGKNKEFKAFFEEKKPYLIKKNKELIKQLKDDDILIDICKYLNRGCADGGYSLQSRTAIQSLGMKNIYTHFIDDIYQIHLKALELKCSKLFGKLWKKIFKNEISVDLQGFSRKKYLGISGDIPVLSNTLFNIKYKYMMENYNKEENNNKYVSENLDDNEDVDLDANEDD